MNHENDNKMRRRSLIAAEACTGLKAAGLGWSSCWLTEKGEIRASRSNTNRQRENSLIGSEANS